MCCTLYYPEVHHLTNDIMSGNPSKKMRFDFQKNDGSVGNEDLWGQDDLTAEEFDMLEIQATQACNQSVALNNNTNNAQNNFAEVEDLKLLQYELEGRIKFLTHSLEKTAKELNEERSNREQLIKERMKVSNERETNLQKEVEKMQSILQFKDQEMKSVYSKMQIMKSQLQERKNTNTDTSSINFEDFLKSSKSSPSKEVSKPSSYRKFQRKHKLFTDIPKGETKGIDILSAILFKRLSLPSFPSYDYTINSLGLEQNIPNNFSISASIMKLKDEQKCNELLEYYSSFLSNHVALLKAVACKNNTTTCKKSSAISSKRKEADYSQVVISCLQDIVYIFSCSKSNPIVEEKWDYEKQPECMDTQKVEAHSSSHIPHSESGMHSAVSTFSQILQLLSELANPKTYPNGYPKNEEIEFSLSALLSISSSSPEKFLNFIRELPTHSLVRPVQNVAAICTTMKLLTILCSCKKFISFLAHRDNNCVFCLISDYLINSVPHYPENFALPMTLIENFLCLVFFSTDFLETLLETSECISEVIQGIIISVWRFYQMRENISQSMEIIKKGFLLLHFISYCIPNFKERRSPVENEYISLISSILALSKENNELREFYDLIHTLWDFQTDITEFDLDDSSEETQSSTDDMVVET